MKFKVNVGKFIQSVKPAADIALKNVSKDFRNEPFPYAGMLTIEASQDALCIKAYGGSASIVVKVDKADGYIPDINGAVSIHASEVMNSLKSFLPTDKLVVSAQSLQMTLSLESDPEMFIELAASPDLFICPPIPNKSNIESLVDRACFVKGMQTIAYAMSEEEKMFTYMCMLFESWKNKMRFSAGSGGRFACLNISSDNQQISEGETKILFPRINVSNVIRILKDSNHSDLRIRTAECDVRNNIREQIILENGSITLALYDIEKYTEYPDLSKIFKRNYSFCISTDIREWKSAIEAIKATYHSHEHKIHNTEITANLLHGYFEVRTNSKMQIKRKVDFWLGAHVTDFSKVSNHKPWFRCNSEFILEMVKKGYKDGLVTFHFDDQTKLDEIPDDQPKQMMPVLVTFSEKINTYGIKEKYAICFSVSSKK